MMKVYRTTANKVLMSIDLSTRNKQIAVIRRHSIKVKYIVYVLDNGLYDFRVLM